MEWHGDILGTGFESCSFEARGSDGVARQATLVRHVPESGRNAVNGAVLFLHGWSDYFFNVDLASFWSRQGFRFYALDMHNHGRNLQDGSTGGYVEHLHDYDAEVAAAIGMIRSEVPEGGLPLTLMGHSTGGLVAALWVSRHPGMVQFLVLNSPWLEMHGSSLVRKAAQLMVAPVARLRPLTVLRLPERGFYYRSISSNAEGEWSVDEKYRPPYAFPLRAGWLSAVLSGHTEVARGLAIDIPILVLLSGASANGMIWRESMRHSDAVLDVNIMALRAMTLGRSVTLERVDGGLHDVFLSAPPVRADAYARLGRWIRGVILDAGPDGSGTREGGHS
ncbi:lysophospholipase [Arthrobacter sp. SW1]|uniref:alpha/beta hydrolase n=1 Tax=Arthrobacter sp. SW1 TaxID=1920889 RepID=UPI000877C4DA|nr:alpha/beta hydrolase [Arthrobacter sp. SW1]OFI37949.1 lysophospholipase [Arthrobacter sp. SW1]